MQKEFTQPKRSGSPLAVVHVLKLFVWCLQVGRFLLEKKDLHNYESYPIWRLEQGRMMRKFEMIIENGRIHHKAVSTVSGSCLRVIWLVLSL